MSAPRNNPNPNQAVPDQAVPDQAVCEACGRPWAVHPLMISFANLRTSRDCKYILELRDIERGVLGDVLRLAGADASGVSTTVLRSCAELLHRWRSRQAP